MLSASATISQIGKKYRNKLQIANSILKAAGTNPGGLSKTKIMYLSFLSYAQVKAYFIFLLENKLLKYSDETEKYAPTENGFKFIKQYEQLTEMVPESVS